jgi:Carboxypeptidase regulatory-like domain/TonB-dependent Receptor Plug Domain
MRASKVMLIVLGGFVLAALTSPSLQSQSLSTGEVSGTITDPALALVTNASITLKSVYTGATQETRSNSTGFYRFPLLKPGAYQVSVKQSGFAEVVQQADVQVGRTTTLNITLELAPGSETIEVSGTGVPVITESPNPSTWFSQAEIQSLPSPGNDITNIAQTAPGVLVNNAGGYGNFTLNGLPATSNLFTVNGENDMDPSFNINNSGATNLTIGANEIQEATILASPYSGEYGQLAGAQLSYVTKSGTNEFHGNALYWWNGRALNANDWMNNNSGTPRPFANANQWAASVGGPILRNKTFFFVDTEGLRFVLPTVFTTTIPTPAFASAASANVQALQPAEYPLYQKMFQLYANAPGASNAKPIPNNDACNSLALPGFDPSTQHCAERFQASPSALATEWILAFRIDQKVGVKDTLFGRYKIDHGLQPSALDAISQNFDALSNQPAWDIQLQETHVLSPTASNSFIAAGSHYVAQFQQSQPLASQTFPVRVITSGSVNFSGFNPLTAFPQGRNVTQYQFIDDLSVTRGKHAFKFGANFRRYDFSDHNFFFNYPGVYFGYGSSGLQEFIEGLAFQYRQSDNLAASVPIALWGLGIYGMDQWRVRPNLTLTLALRLERNSNPVCQVNCFANFVSSWYALPSYTSANPGNVPYNQDIATGLHRAYPGVDNIDAAPRFGFSWSPLPSGKTVVSGGFGIFYDSPPAGLVDNLLGNPPISVAIRVRPHGGVLWADPGPNGGAAIYQQSAAAFNSGFASGKTYSQISSALEDLGVTFAAPAFTTLAGTIHAPRWQQWNLQLQQQLSASTAIAFNYIGNHGTRILYTSTFLNAYDEYGLYPPGTFPTSAPVPNYGVVAQVANGAVSNYNAFTVSLRRNFSHWISAHVNYSWSHNLDEESNGGIANYSADSLLQQICPQSLKSCNYGNSDYDIRNVFSGDFVFQPTFGSHHAFLRNAINGWEFSGKIFWRSGLPFSILDGNSALGDFNGPILGTPVPSVIPAQPTSCGQSAASATGNGMPCLNASAFLNASSNTFTGYPGVSPQRRNQFLGPYYFDLDLAVFKTFQVSERLQFAIGAQAYNAFNHPNFGNPDVTLGDSTFGQISSMVGVPTSPYGSGLGFDSSPRVVQISGRVIF